MNTAHRPNIKPGRYRHYKGADYQVIDLARHSENEEWFVVYKPLYGESCLWIRPANMFVEDIETEKGLLPRFRYIDDL